MLQTNQTVLYPNKVGKFYALTPRKSKHNTTLTHANEAKKRQKVTLLVTLLVTLCLKNGKKSPGISGVK